MKSDSITQQNGVTWEIGHSKEKHRPTGQL
jgi:hypothetical protein